MSAMMDPICVCCVFKNDKNEGTLAGSHKRPDGVAAGAAAGADAAGADAAGAEGPGAGGVDAAATAGFGVGAGGGGLMS